MNITKFYRLKARHMITSLCLIIQHYDGDKLSWFGYMHRGWKKTEIPKTVLYINLETTRFRDRSRNRWQDKVREDGRMVGEEWQEKVYKIKLLRTAKNHPILHANGMMEVCGD
jgi:hypothetical protein